MQISPCLQNVALLLKSHHHLCKMDRIIDKKGFPAKNFIQINNRFVFSTEKLEIFLCAWTHACNSYRHDFNSAVSGDWLIKIGAALRTKLQKLPVVAIIIMEINNLVA